MPHPNPLPRWANAVCCTLLILGISGCGMKLHPLLVEHLGRELRLGEEVDVKVEVIGFWATQKACVKEDPFHALLKGPLLGCAKMSCAVNKMWKTDKICTCIVHLAFENKDLLAHELQHCRGLIHHVYEKENLLAHGLEQCPGSVHLAYEHEELLVHDPEQCRESDLPGAAKENLPPSEMEQCKEVTVSCKTYLRIPVKSATQSSGNRPVIPEEIGHLFQ